MCARACGCGVRVCCVHAHAILVARTLHPFASQSQILPFCTCFVCLTGRICFTTKSKATAAVIASGNKEPITTSLLLYHNCA